MDTNTFVVAGIGAAILYNLWRIRMNQAELKAKLDAMTAQNEKARAEQQAAFKKLQDALDAAGNTTPEVDAAVEALGASIQAEDDENPDADPPPAGKKRK